MNTIELKSPEVTSQEQQLSSAIQRQGTPISPLLQHIEDCRLFHSPPQSGMIGYQLIRNHAVVIGNPLCSPQYARPLNHAFTQYCQRNNWKILYFLASDAFAQEAMHDGCSISIQVGEQLFLNPLTFKKKNKLRWKINQSLQQGVRIEEYQQSDPSLEQQIKRALQTWIESRRGPQIYLGRFDLCLKQNGNRLFLAMHEGKIAGLLSLSRIDRFQGWVVTHFFALATAPKGTTEHMIASLIELLAVENCRTLCLGIVAGNKLGDIKGLSLPSKLLARSIFNLSKWLFRLEKRKIYLNKYQPHSRPMYLIFRDKMGMDELLTLKKLLNICL